MCIRYFNNLYEIVKKMPETEQHATHLYEISSIVYVQIKLGQSFAKTKRFYSFGI